MLSSPVRSDSYSGSGVLGQVHEQEAAVRIDRDRVERVGRPLEPFVLVDVRRPDEAALEVVRPGVVRALEDLADVAAGGLVVEQLRAPMRADVVEGVERPGAVAVTKIDSPATSRTR